MEQKTFFITVAIIFGLVSLLHLIRAVLSWEWTIANFSIPVWLSYIVFIVIGYLAYTSFKMGK